ncbi:MAG: hypothetical protein ACRESJ_20865 [Pseudomonas sp.]|uniref:hypothetical protein n=1 Tax=Pseudomonas sp. TaxID=306 RepID=UPI003D6FA267
MNEVKTVGHEHQGHKFDVHVEHRPAGYIYFVDIHLPGAALLQIHSGDDIYRDADSAHFDARLRAWEIIDGHVNAAAQ